MAGRSCPRALPLFPLRRHAAPCYEKWDRLLCHLPMPQSLVPTCQLGGFFLGRPGRYLTRQRQRNICTVASFVLCLCFCRHFFFTEKVVKMLGIPRSKARRPIDTSRPADLNAQVLRTRAAGSLSDCHPGGFSIPFIGKGHQIDEVVCRQVQCRHAGSFTFTRLLVISRSQYGRRCT